MITSEYTSEAPARAEIEAMTGPVVLNFGTNWCGYCRAAESIIAAGLAEHEEVPHLKVEDGPGRPLGRSFHVKLWPTLIFLRDGKEVARVVRPNDPADVQEGLRAILG